MPKGLPSLRCSWYIQYYIPSTQLAVSMGGEYRPELEMDDPVNPNLGDVAEVEDPIGGASYAQEEDTRDSEEGGSEVGFLSRLGDRGVEGDERCILV